MRPSLGVIGISASLLLLAFITLAYPHVMIAPGPLIPAHHGLNRNCFACHAPFRGVSSTRCMTCHAPEKIGILTTKAIRLKIVRKEMAFHGKLITPNCVACHSDHSGPRLTRHVRKPFAHELLIPTIRSRCDACHEAPTTPLHRGIQSGCTHCHTVAGWKPAHFDHNRYFRLDGDHDAPCVTCHQRGTFRQYSCFGCHEHKQPQIFAEHAEEGIHDINNCARCHRSSEEVEQRGESGDDDGDDDGD